MRRLVALASTTVLLACATEQGARVVERPIPSAHEIFAPEPIPDSSGKYVSPFTSEGVVAKWVDDGMKAQLAEGAGQAVGGAVGQIAGAEIGSRVLGQLIPGGALLGSLLGGMIGQAAGDELGGQAGKAIALAGGEEKMRESSDLSFNSAEELAIWMYANHSQSEHYAQVLEFASVVYPELKNGYDGALRGAALRPAAAPAAVAEAPAASTSSLPRLGLVKTLTEEEPAVPKLRLGGFASAAPEAPASDEGGLRRLSLVPVGGAQTPAGALGVATRSTAASLMDGVPPPVVKGKPPGEPVVPAVGGAQAQVVTAGAEAPAPEPKAVRKLSIIRMGGSREGSAR